MSDGNQFARGNNGITAVEQPKTVQKADIVGHCLICGSPIFFCAGETDAYYAAKTSCPCNTLRFRPPESLHSAWVGTAFLFGLLFWGLALYVAIRLLP